MGEKNELWGDFKIENNGVEPIIANVELDLTGIPTIGNYNKEESLW